MEVRNAREPRCVLLSHWRAAPKFRRLLAKVGREPQERPKILNLGLRLRSEGIDLANQAIALQKPRVA
jgi:hypothetical protein